MSANNGHVESARAPQPEATPQDLAEIFGEPVSTYTRRQAIEDGTLIDVTSTAKQAGFRFPVALTSRVYHEYVRVPEGVKCQDEAGRLWDILTMLYYAIKRAPAARDELFFELHVRNDNEERTPPLVQLRSICGGDDEGRPCITICCGDED